MRTVTYAQIKNLAAQLAGRTDDTAPNSVRLPTSEATALRAFFDAELRDIWNKEAWPELCDNLESITLDANKCFDKREGDADEIGDILAIIEGSDPRTTTTIGDRLPADKITELDGRVNVMTSQESVWVDWQTPAPNLLDSDLDDTDDLDAYTIPERFKLVLAYRGAAHLVSLENPMLSAKYEARAETELARQRARLRIPWWRMPVKE